MYFSSNIIPVIKSRRMRRVGDIACMGERRGVYRDLWGKLKERDHLEDPGVDGRIILNWTFRKRGGGMDWIDLTLDRDRLRAVVNAVMNLQVL